MSTRPATAASRTRVAGSMICGPMKSPGITVSRACSTRVEQPAVDPPVGLVDRESEALVRQVAAQEDPGQEGAGEVARGGALAVDSSPRDSGVRAVDRQC